MYKGPNSVSHYLKVILHPKYSVEAILVLPVEMLLAWLLFPGEEDVGSLQICKLSKEMRAP